MKKLFSFLFFIFLVACDETAVDPQHLPFLKRANGVNITVDSFNEDSQKIVTLGYEPIAGLTPESCKVSDLVSVTETQSCTCSGGVCTVGVTGTSNYFGAASFKYTIDIQGITSSVATASLNISNTADAPVATLILAGVVASEAQKIVTLAYVDVDGDLATTCATSSLNNLLVTQACVCDAFGVCTVGVTSTVGYAGAADFHFTVTANGDVSSSAVASLTVTPSVNAPVSANISPVAFNEDTQSIITLSYSDPQNDLATTCALSALSNITITQACVCSGAGVCTVGVTGTSNYFGAASFNYTVTAGGDISNSALATLTVASVDDPPVADNLTPASFASGSQRILTLTYTDVESHLASSCTLSSLSNVTVTQACLCTVGGVCTVGVTGTAGYGGSAGFSFTVTANTLASNSATASFTLTIPGPPVGSNQTLANLTESTETIITLPYTDPNGDLATSCTVGNIDTDYLINSTACSCNGSGVCTVGIKGVQGVNSASGELYSFTYFVTANGDTSVYKTMTFSITPVDFAPVSTAVTYTSEWDSTVMKIVTLNYTDLDYDKATSCTVSSLQNLTVSQACSCNGSGACTVGVTGSGVGVGTSASGTFNFTVTANAQTSNASAATLPLYNFGCPTNYIGIPANTSLGTSRFCVMAFEAKNVGSVATSQPATAPWVSINFTNAKAACTALGASYALISNPEWMTIARNIEGQVALNTYGNAYYRGHSDNAPSNSLAVSNVNDPYDGTEDSAISNMLQRRTHILSNGNTVWDLAGNVEEWVDWVVPIAQKATSSTVAVGNAADFFEVDTSISGADPMYSALWMPLTNLSWTSNVSGYGRYIAGSAAVGGYAIRGGCYSRVTAQVGIYTLIMNLNSTSSTAIKGFRCVYHP